MLEITALSIQLGEFSFSDLNLDVKEGEYCIILGPTGAGKTILLETIAGIHYPKSGRICLNGKDITNTPPESRGIGMVYQDYMLFPHMTVGENIDFGLKEQGVAKPEREAAVKKIAATFGISHLLDRHPQTLSGGEQQRTAIARSLLLRPSVLLLDEPLSALDTITRERLRNELKAIHTETGMTILHITHHFEDIYALADRVIVMREGKIIQEGTPDTILRHPISHFIANFTGMDNIFTGYAEMTSSGVAEIRIGTTIIRAVTELTGQVHAGIRPEDMIISSEPFTSSAQNSFSGVVTQIIDVGAYSKIIVDTGLLLTAILTHQSIQRLGITVGTSIWVTFKATSVHVFRE
ncbi:ATP-binding cassette domain-containing protein [uncultured Methanocorpusculum sp.]|nr:ATP-binding cassette domain-containing protein [uncultured Methanocorpusculum sp.]